MSDRRRNMSYDQMREERRRKKIRAEDQARRDAARAAKANAKAVANHPLLQQCYRESWKVILGSRYVSIRDIRILSKLICKFLSSILQSEEVLWKDLCHHHIPTQLHEAVPDSIKAVKGHYWLFAELAPMEPLVVPSRRVKAKAPKPGIRPEQVSFFVRICDENDKVLVSRTLDSGDDLNFLFGLSDEKEAKMSTLELSRKYHEEIEAGFRLKDLQKRHSFALGFDKDKDDDDDDYYFGGDEREHLPPGEVYVKLPQPNLVMKGTTNERQGQLIRSDFIEKMKKSKVTVHLLIENGEDSKCICLCQSNSSKYDNEFNAGYYDWPNDLMIDGEKKSGYWDRMEFDCDKDIHLNLTSEGRSLLSLVRDDEDRSLVRQVKFATSFIYFSHDVKSQDANAGNGNFDIDFDENFIAETSVYLTHIGLQFHATKSKETFGRSDCSECRHMMFNGDWQPCDAEDAWRKSGLTMLHILEHTIGLAKDKKKPAKKQNRQRVMESSYRPYSDY